MKADVYQKVTDKIVADLEKGELSWLKPWNAGNLEGRITKPLRHNGMPYNGINVLMLWSASVDRDFGRKRWGDEGYAKEELVAELGAAFLCADLELTPEPGTDHAAYIQSWLKVLKEDKRAIFSAAAHAQKAADFLHGLQPMIEEEQEEEGVAA